MWVLVAFWHFVCADPGQLVIMEPEPFETYAGCNRRLQLWMQASADYALRNDRLMAWPADCVRPEHVADELADHIDTDRQASREYCQHERGE